MSSGIILARNGTVLRLQQGQILRVTNTHGHQVVDTWAFCSTKANRPPVGTSSHQAHFNIEYMSMCHTRAAINAIRPTVGSTLVSNRRAPMLTLVKDTSPGIHDTLIAACDIYRYRGLIPDLGDSYHDNCSDNLQQGLLQAEEDEDLADAISDFHEIRKGLHGWVPDPLNLFMNIPWQPSTHGELSFESPVSKPGDYVELKAETEVVIVMSACPQDILTINGGKPVDAHWEIISN